MQRKGPKEASLRPATMRDDPALAQAAFYFRPEREKIRRISQVVVADPVDLLGCPGNGALRLEIASEE